LRYTVGIKNLVQILLQSGGKLREVFFTKLEKRGLTMNAIRVEGLTKAFSVKQKAAGLMKSIHSIIKPQYAEKIAIDHIDLTVGHGEIVAFMGPNGAGKSTTIKMLTGILHPTEGAAHVLGFCPWKERSRLAYQIAFMN